MNMKRITTALTVVNLVILSIVLTRLQPTIAQSKQPMDKLPVLKGSGLEIVDQYGRVRASISIEPPVVMNGIHYPETVLLRLADPKYGPLVKISAAANGSAIGLSDEAEGGVQILARDTGMVFRMTNRGRERVIRP
jgi:hypothetical protein